MLITENLLTPGGNRPGKKIIGLQAVVLHWLAAPNQRPIETRSWWENGSAVGSAHYIIGTDGMVMRTIPENEIGYHIGSSQKDPKSRKIYTDKARELFGRKVCEAGMCNFYAIGIELSHTNMDPGTFTEATLQAAAELSADILRRHEKTTGILTTHHELVGWKDCPRLWTNAPELFEAFKTRVQSLI